VHSVEEKWQKRAKIGLDKSNAAGSVASSRETEAGSAEEQPAEG